MSGDVSGQDQTSPASVVRLGYNRYLTSSFSDAPAPLEAIRSEVKRKHPHITIELSVMPETVRGHHDALVVWMLAQDGTVDIYGLDAPWVAEFGEARWAEPLNQHLSELDDDFLPSGLEVFSHHGQRLGVPIWTSLGGLFYRKDLIEQAGLSAPQTYDQLVQCAKAITTERPELEGFVWPGAKGEDLIQTWAEIFRGFGGQYFDEQGRCDVNSAAGVQALQFMTKLIQEGVTPRDAVSWNSEQARTRFANGRAVFLRNNHDPLTWLDDPVRSKVVGRWAFVPNPKQGQGRSTGITGGYAFALNPFTDVREDAIRVMRVIASRPVQKALALAWGPVQHFRRLYDDPEVLVAHPRLPELEAALPTAFARPRSVDYARLSDILQEELHSALAGIKPPQAALDHACQRIDLFSQ
jgi:multiple sugar transport system substrate-binding protein